MLTGAVLWLSSPKLRESLRKLELSFFYFKSELITSYQTLSDFDPDASEGSHEEASPDNVG